MKPVWSIKQVFSNAEAIRRAVSALTEKDVYIGVPAENAGQRSGGINNAELSWLHEFGAPAAGIPARPHLLPGVEDIRNEAVKILKDAAQKALDGKENAVEPALERIGLLGQNAVRARFQNNDWPPLKDATLDAAPLKKDDEGNVIRDKKGNARRGKSRREKGRVNPLLDTGQLMKSHTHVVRKRGSA
ncbi:hypothetical protein [uncultured Desulfovibrio sp.]|uniref:hypothetical protein n=1 Tax=uncultured Desulfovibrio sp. TaxID=167968 RepID=UPI00261BD7F7|nr:hypothetical protein [uncultured Desulfovibrio sp.]